MSTRDPFQPEPRRSALRLTFSARGGEIKALSEQQVEMQTPPSDPLDEYEGHAGNWFELRDARGRVIYRRIIRHPIDTHREAPSGDPDRPLVQVPVKSPESIFVVLAPDLPDAVSLHLFATDPSVRSEAAREIARHRLQGGTRKE